MKEDIKDVINLNEYREEDDLEGLINLKEYSESPEAQEASWWDLAKDVIVQPALGAAKAFTWPLDVLKIGMVGEALTDLDELEMAFEKQGKHFDRDEYLKHVSEQSQFIPTQQLLEDVISSKTNFDLAPKTETGKYINKFFTLATMLRGSGATKAITGAATGSGATSALKALGVNETASEFAGDIVAGGTALLKKTPRQLTPEVAALEKTAAKHNLPFPEYLTKEPSQLVGPKITEGRRIAAQKELGMSSQQAIEDIISGKLNVSKIRKQGVDLDVLVSDAYDNVSNLAKSNPNPIPTNQIVNDIKSEIARIKKLAPSPSQADQSAINILQKEMKVLEKKPANTEQLTQQIKNYNSNVSEIYKRPEFSGREDSVRSAYAFLNNSIRNTIEKESGPEVRQAMKVADSLYAEKSKLDRVENMISKAFKNGEYNPKKLTQVIGSKEGKIVRRELGDKAVDEIVAIAKYGEQAVKNTNLLARSPVHSAQIAEWGPLAGYLLAKMPKSSGIFLAAKPVADHVRGYLLMKPATRMVYKDIVKNAAKGSYKNMAVDFAKLEAEITKDFGSVDDFMKSMLDEVRIYKDEED